MVHNRNDAPIVQARYFAKDGSLADRGLDIRYILLDVIGTKAAGCSPVFDDFPKRAARPDDVRRETVHIKVTLIADDKPVR
jgi:hypothetical protein